jgi:DNA-binding NtrC family response regulator
VSRSDDSLLAGRSILIVDDHEPHRTLLWNYLSAVGCDCTGAGGGMEALDQLSKRSFDLVLLDLRMDDLDGMQVLKRAKAEGILSPTVMMSAEGTISHAVDAIRLGAKDFLVKPFELEQLHDTVCRVLGASRSGSSGGPDPRMVWRDAHAPDCIGEHPALLEVFLVLERIAATDCTVLITGESGTGKELVARALHHASKRINKAFVPVNCGAIPETLIESELFGHAKGAFSGATSAREGRFAVADGGTLFLDEIGEMSLSVQVKFLRVLQEQEFVPVGETRPRKCDVRILAATNKNLEKMSEEATFREDLFYRLNLIPIQLPSLRERLSDVPILANHFLERMRKRSAAQIQGFSPGLLEAMTTYTWPGNVRELENTIERMTLLHQGAGTLDVEDLPPKIRRDSGRMPHGSSSVGTLHRASGVALPGIDNTLTREAPRSPAPPSSVLAFRSATPPPPAPDPASSGEFVAIDLASDSAVARRVPASPDEFLLPKEGIDLRAAVELFEMSLIEQALERTGGNKNQASILLGMNRTTLVEKLRKRKKAQGSS